MPFVKGKSGNPRGRPKRGKSLAERVRWLTDPDEVVRFLLRVMADSSTAMAERLKAANMLLDRGWGRPLQSVELDATVTRPSALAEVLARLPDERLSAAAAILFDDPEDAALDVAERPRPALAPGDPGGLTAAASDEYGGGGPDQVS